MQVTPSAGQGAAPAEQPTAGLQVSAPLQNRPSLQLNAVPPPHAPALQVSPEVQAFASLQAVPSATGAAAQPSSASQASVVQVLPSLQAASTVVCVQAPSPASQASVVQDTPSSQFTGVPGAQTPFTHASKPLQSAPSWQSASSTQFASSRFNRPAP